MRKIIGFILFLAVHLSASSQMTMIFENDLDHYNKGLELLEKNKFGAAKQQFEHALEDISDQNSEISANAHFYIAQCALELFHKDAEFLLRQFIQNYSTSPRVPDAWYLLGAYNYRKKDWDETIQYFDHLEVADLEEPRLSEYLFKKGYAHFMLEQLDPAADQFYQLRDESSIYYAPGVYYYGHINYSLQKYATALKSFQKLESHPQFGEVVPYYIVQVHYYLEDYEALIAYGSQFISREDVKRKHEISRLIGEAFYARQMYDEAIPFLEDYILSPYQKQKTDYYQVGYAMLKGGRYDDAAAYLSKVSYAEDSLAQNAQYHMGEAYLKADKKAYARNAYRSASRSDFDPFISEDALFKFAKLAYELSYDPYDGAIAAFKEYTETYPSAAHTKEAFDYLVKIYLTSKNYDAALASIEEYENPDFRLQEAYQRIAFNKGVNEFQEGRFQNAIRYFDKAQVYPSSKIVAARAQYWKGESYYNRAEYERAAKAYKEFLFAPGAIISGLFNMAHYGIGYSYFQQDKFSKAPEWFRRFVAYKDEQDEQKLADANLRIADCFYMLKNYNGADEYYRAASKIGGSDPDYALFQIAMTNGLLNDTEGKVTMLQKLVADYPESKYLDEGYYEIGKANQRLGKDDEALRNFRIVVDDYQSSSYVRKALVSIAQIYYNQEKNSEAEAIYMQVIEQFPTYDDTKEALLGLQNIYVERGDIDGYQNLLNGLDFVKVSELELDSLSYSAARNLYFDGDCSNAVQNFTRYLDRYASGSFKLDAHFYRAECLYKMGQVEEALEDYEMVASLPKNRFSESALARAASLNYEKGQYPEALAFYKRLALFGEYPDNLRDAEIGQMRCNFELNNFQGAIANATITLDDEKLEPNIKKEATLIIAKSYLKLGNAAQAVPYLKEVVETGSPSQAAESMYYIARFEFNQDSLDRSEETIFKLVESYQNEGYWLAKGLILLSDIYTTRGDLFQAKATLESILENYKEEDDVKLAARQKMETITEIENEEKALEIPDLEIFFDPADSTQINSIEEQK